MIDIVEIDVGKEGLTLDLVGIGLPAAKPAGWVAFKQLQRQTAQIEYRVSLQYAHAGATRSGEWGKKRTHALKKLDGARVHRDRVERRVLKDGVKDLVLVVAPEGRLAEQHLVRQDTKGPPVDRARIWPLKQDLKRRRRGVRLARLSNACE